MRAHVLLLGGLVVLGAACSLNPQPLPPDKPVDSGLAVDANWLGGGSDASSDVTVQPPPDEAGVDASVDAPSEASDAAEDGDASGEDGGFDGGLDASDDGDGA